jgi:hypothetical protein
MIVRNTTVSDTPLSSSLTIVILTTTGSFMLLELSITLLEKVYSTCVTNDDRHMTIKIFLQCKPLMPMLYALFYGRILRPHNPAHCTRACTCTGYATAAYFATAVTYGRRLFTALAPIFGC